MKILKIFLWSFLSSDLTISAWHFGIFEFLFLKDVLPFSTVSATLAITSSEIIYILIIKPSPQMYIKIKWVFLANILDNNSFTILNGIRNILASLSSPDRKRHVNYYHHFGSDYTKIFYEETSWQIGHYSSLFSTKILSNQVEFGVGKNGLSFNSITRSPSSWWNHIIRQKLQGWRFVQIPAARGQAYTTSFAIVP